MTELQILIVVLSLLAGIFGAACMISGLISYGIVGLIGGLFAAF